jgi:hypothetical protein
MTKKNEKKRGRPKGKSSISKVDEPKKDEKSPISVENTSMSSENVEFMQKPAKSPIITENEPQSYQSVRELGSDSRIAVTYRAQMDKWRQKNFKRIENEGHTGLR